MGEFLVELHPISTSALTLCKEAAPTGHLASPHHASDLSVSPLSPSSLLCPDGTQRPPPCLSGVPGLKGSRCPRASTTSTNLSPSVRDREFPLTAENSALKTVCVPSRPGMATQKQWEHPSVSSHKGVPAHTHRHMHAHTHTHTHTHVHTLLPHSQLSHSLLPHSQTRHLSRPLECTKVPAHSESLRAKSSESASRGIPPSAPPPPLHPPIFSFFFFAALQGLWGLSSLTGNGTQAPQQGKRGVLTTGPPGKSPHSPHWSSQPHTCNRGKCHPAWEHTHACAHTHPWHCALSPPHPRNQIKFEARHEG